MSSKKNTEQLTLWSEEVLASLSQSPENGEDLKIQEETSCLNIAELLEPFARNTSSGKTSREHFQATKDGTFLPSSGRWLTSGIAYAGECSMLNGLESPKEDVECSLSEVLEKTPVDSKFYLSERAAKGILERAKKRGKTIPPKLKAALINMIKITSIG